MVEMLKHTLCQMSSYLIADDNKNWDDMLMHTVEAHNNNVSRGTGLSSSEVHIGKYPRLPMTTLEGRSVRGHQGLKQDQLDFFGLMRDGQIKTFELVTEEDCLIKARHAAADEHLEELRSRYHKYSAGEWVWVYNDHSTICRFQASGCVDIYYQA